MLTALSPLFLPFTRTARKQTESAPVLAASFEGEPGCRLQEYADGAAVGYLSLHLPLLPEQALRAFLANLSWLTSGSRPWPAVSASHAVPLLSTPSQAEPGARPMLKLHVPHAEGKALSLTAELRIDFPSSANGATLTAPPKLRLDRLKQLRQSALQLLGLPPEASTVDEWSSDPVECRPTSVLAEQYGLISTEWLVEPDWSDGHHAHRLHHITDILPDVCASIANAGSRQIDCQAWLVVTPHTGQLHKRRGKMSRAKHARQDALMTAYRAGVPLQHAQCRLQIALPACDLPRLLYHLPQHVRRHGFHAQRIAQAIPEWPTASQALLWPIFSPAELACLFPTKEDHHA